MFKIVDKLLEHVTMYKLLLYYLIALILAAMGLSMAGVLHLSAISIASTTIILLVACWIVNEVFAGIFRAPTNVESVYITALILALIISPLSNGSAPQHFAFLLAASGLAMSSKYILTINRKHIFNPAALAVALTALGPRQSADWWVGTAAMLPFVVVGGALLVYKIRRVRMVLTFFVSALAATALYSLIGRHQVFTALNQTVRSSALLFLGFVMLTEPLTTPPTAKKQTWYAALTGILFPPQFHILSFYSTPELALVISNIFSYIVSPKYKLFPRLKEKVKITPDSADFVFSHGVRRFKYKPGQYMEWTLPHNGTDLRGNRRYFTLASSPTEPDLRIGIKFYQPSSSFKRTLLNITSGSPIVAAQVSGDFTMPRDSHRKLAFIAGGIGVTPYRSMVKYLLDTKEKRSVTLLYSARTSEDFAYQEVFEQARRDFGMNTKYIVTDQKISNSGNYLAGRLNSKLISSEIPDYMDRIFYISGTQPMVKAIKADLKELNIPRRQIKVDYFPGYG